MKLPAIPPPVNAAFKAYPLSTRQPLQTLRRIIFEQAERLDVGPLTETLKWGEPAYLTEVSRSGTTIRLGWHKSFPEHFAAFFNCKTSLVDEVRAEFKQHFEYIKNRAVLAPCNVALDETCWRACFEKALTYKWRTGR